MRRRGVSSVNGALPGQVLHAVRLALDHPISGERLVCEAPLPEVFEKLLLALRRRSS